MCPLRFWSEISARAGVTLETSPRPWRGKLLSGWVGTSAAALQPMVDALAVAVVASERRTPQLKNR